MRLIDAEWQSHFSRMPLVAILRGITPEEALAVGRCLLDAGISIMEVPLNSPKPFDTIKLMVDAFSTDAIIGAGTVLKASSVSEVKEAGGQLIVAPNVNGDVARAALDSELLYCPGIATPSEAFQALELGANALKLFPAELITPKATKAMRAVLPAEVQLLPVGGISANNMSEYLGAGANGFGIGSALYKPAKPASEVALSAKAFVAACE